MHVAVTEHRDDLVDRLMLMSLYCEWRNECAEVTAASDRFSHGPLPERAVAFAAYVAALDREQCAADAYASHISLARSLREINDN